MNDPFQPVRQMQWIVQCWADGLSDYTSARTMAKSGLWPRILTLHAQLANSNAVGRDIQPVRCRPRCITCSLTTLLVVGSS